MSRKSTMLSYIIIIVTTIIKLEVNASFYEKKNSKSFESTIYEETGVPSLLACAQLCKFRDAKSIVVFNEELCQCIKKSTQEDKNVKTMATDGFCMERKKMVERRDRYKETNVALNKPSTQTSDYSKLYIAAHGNDGVISKYAITKYSSVKKLAWEVDLQQNFLVQRMVFYTSYYASKKANYIRNLVISMRQSRDHENWKVCKNVGRVPSTEYEIVCDAPTTARYVQVALEPDGKGASLYLAEFKVFAMVKYTAFELN